MLQNLFKGTFNLDLENLYVRYYGYEDEKLPAAHSPNFQQSAFSVIVNLCWNMVANVAKLIQRDAQFLPQQSPIP